VVPEITTGNLSRLVKLPGLTRACTQDGAGIPILRTGVQAPSAWDAYTPPRSYVGYSSTMTDDEALAAADRWWPYSGSDSVLTAASMITVIGGWSVLLLAVEGIKQEILGGGHCSTTTRDSSLAATTSRNSKSAYSTPPTPSQATPTTSSENEYSEEGAGPSHG
jgi:hypothetical protein